MTKLPEWIIEATDCCGVHSPELREAFNIAWVELENIDKVCVCEEADYAKQAMNRIAQLGDTSQGEELGK